MSDNPLALTKTILATTFNLYVKPIMNEDLKKKFFPPSVESQILTEVKRISSRLDEVKNEVAKLRIQPARKAFNKNIDFYRKSVIPIILSECKKGSPNLDSLEELANKMDAHCEDFSGEINNASDIISDKRASCDFAVRVLFGLTRDMYSLHLAMLSWTRALYSLIPNKEYKLEIYDRRISNFIEEVVTQSNEHASGLYSARLDKIKFEIDIDRRERFEKGSTVPIFDVYKVYCLYKDTFSSTEKEDPFIGNEIYHKIDKEYSSWNPFAPGKGDMTTAWSDAEKHKINHAEHLKVVTRLANDHIVNPNENFVNFWQKAITEKIRIDS